LLLLVLCLCPSASAQTKAQGKSAGISRDWQKYPAVVEVDTKHDIYAVGDPHGDYERLVTVLAKAKIIAGDPGPPEKVQWTAGKAMLICTGDMIDKGPESLRVIALFRALQPAAQKAGGRVIVTMGNHEATFLADPLAKKAKDFRDELTTKANLNPAEVAAGKDKLGIGQFLRNLPVAARINEWFFAHAGNTHGRTLKQLRLDLEQDVSTNGFQAKMLQADDSIVEARLKPLWWQKDTETPAQGRARLASYVKALGVQHLVIGHQPGHYVFDKGVERKKGHMFQAYNGLIFLIDTGMSRMINYSDGAVLHIHTGKKPKATALYPTAAPKQLWP